LSEHITRWKVFALLLGLIGFVLIGIRATGEHGPNALFRVALAFLSSLSAAGRKPHVQKARASREFAGKWWQEVYHYSAYHRNSP
jgi:hypothetical protein